MEVVLLLDLGDGYYKINGRKYGLSSGGGSVQVLSPSSVSDLGSFIYISTVFESVGDLSQCLSSLLSSRGLIRLGGQSTDRCSWDRVYCDETTGHVIELDLSCSQLQGKSNISPKFGGMSDLTHLDLWGLSFIGQIPSEISYLSKLNVLRIWSEDPYMITFGPHNFELLLRNLTQLRYLEIYDVNISSTIPRNFSSYLTTIQLWNEQLCGTLPERIFHLPNLKLLELSYNSQLTISLPMNK
ncbi:hypothetical protein T459_01651 [Capsicum annuum]|uniref:Leucine-rich repeat-containing N-terminal plant-type domain-containing protein n=1 Tax=Capsicum annuum TaxID=4072 RepID=A0A2G3AHQ6_CAPAN|nr:hypothetical protein T459_01651 [Capsicum annuum]